MNMKSANAAQVRGASAAGLGRLSAARKVDPDIAIRKAQIAVDRLSVGRDAIEQTDVGERAGWAMVINEVIEAGIAPSELEQAFAATENTVYKWRQGLTAPRLLTRRLLKNALVEMIDERIQEKAPA